MNPITAIAPKIIAPAGLLIPNLSDRSTFVIATVL